MAGYEDKLDLARGFRKKVKENESATRLAKIQVVSVVPTMTPEDVYAVRYLFPQWEDLIGTPLVKDETPYIMYGEQFFLVNQDHTPQLEWVPGVDTESLYSLVPEPGTISEWVQPLGVHDAYNAYGSGLPKSDPVTYNGQTWICTSNGNIYAPGVFGWEVFTG